MAREVGHRERVRYVELTAAERVNELVRRAVIISGTDNEIHFVERRRPLVMRIANERDRRRRLQRPQRRARLEHEWAGAEELTVFFEDDGAVALREREIEARV